LVLGVAPIATFSGREWEAAPDESFEAFRARAKAAAKAERARFIIFGGLPNVSQVPADSETQAYAPTQGNSALLTTLKNAKLTSAE
jgi:hypothetical protein